MVLAVADEIVGVVSGALDDATPASPGTDPGEAAEMITELPGATDTTPDPATQQQAASTRPGPQLHTGLRPAAAQASVSPIGGPQVSLLALMWQACLSPTHHFDIALIGANLSVVTLKDQNTHSDPCYQVRLKVCSPLASCQLIVCVC